MKKVGACIQSAQENNLCVRPNRLETLRSILFFEGMGFVMKSCCHRGGGSCVGQFWSKTDWCWLLTVPYVFRDIKTVRENIYNWNLNEVKLIHFVEENPWRRAFLWEIIVVSVNAWKGSKYVVFLVPILMYSVRIQENTDQKKLRIWHFFTQSAEQTKRRI